MTIDPKIYEDCTRRNAESMKGLWQFVLNQYVDALDSHDLERAAQLRVKLDEVFNNTVDDNSTMMIHLFREGKL